jgi:hypothetical protein
MCCRRVIWFCLQSDWGVVQRGYYAAVLGEAPHTFTDPVAAVRELKKDNSVSGAQQVLRELGFVACAGLTKGRAVGRAAANVLARAGSNAGRP